MAQKKTSILPKFEIIIIGVFFFSFIIWAASRCGDIKQAAVENLGTEEETTDEPSAVESINADDSTPKDTVYIVRNDTTRVNSSKTYGRLYITIKNLKVRTEPGLNKDVVAQLPLFDEVTFLNEVTDSTYQINLGYEVADEPWVKIRTKSGKEGWVYGAGVNYYKKKRSGVLE